ncbi:HNH endonuclease signature motif containing protein [Paraburkholderia graminis]|uniref:HNH endonuclease signature motif containing protein n=1 Tax=Paraburkholderia graminis TaxID=60548 RepID=UPI0038B72EAF
MPEHPLADSTGQVWEHRKIAYERYGGTLPPCELCGKHITWQTAHIDHKDENRANNDLDNLRHLCRVCNVTRTVQSTAVLLTINGVTQNVARWSKDPRCAVSDATIRQRVSKGWPHERCVFDPPAHRGRPKGSELKKVMNKKARRLERRIEMKREAA